MNDILAGVASLPPGQLAVTTAWLLLQGCVVPSVPEEFVVLTLGMLVGQGRVAPAIALAAVLAGLLPANAAAVTFGSLARKRLGRNGWLGRALASRRVERASELLRRHGPVAVLATRFTPFVRGPVYLAIGFSGFGVRRFMLLDALAASVQVPLLLWAGSRLGDGVSPQQAWTRLGWAIAALLGLAAAVLLSRRAAARWAGRDAPSPAPTLPSS